LKWAWDPGKDEKNRRRHKLPLSVGELALADPLAVSRPDPHPDGDRWNTVGMVDGVTVFVVHTWPDDGDDSPGRVISVRQATKHERRAYENDD